MKIAIDGRMILPHPTGIGRVTINLTRNLVELPSNHEFIIIGPRKPPLRDFPNLQYIEAAIGHLSPSVHTRLPRIITESGADLVNYMYYFTPWHSPVPYAASIFDTTYSHFPRLLPRFHRLLYNLYMKRCMKRAQIVVCPSESTAIDIRRFFPEISNDKIRVVYNGMEERFKPSQIEDRAAALTELGLPDRYILYVGNHRGHKNLPRLIKAFSSIAGHIPHSLVLPQASGRGSEITLKAISASAYSERIILHPMPDEKLPLIYELADLFVFPSLSEGFGLPPLEAMACGTPVIASNSSSLPEVVGDAGLLVDPYNETDLSENMLKVLKDGVLKGEMRVKGLERAKRFSWKEAARQTLTIYEEIHPA